jgi:hypothetical protein
MLYNRIGKAMNKKSSIIHSDFERVIEDDLYYVDKTLLIKDKKKVNSLFISSS